MDGVSANRSHRNYKNNMPFNEDLLTILIVFHDIDIVNGNVIVEPASQIVKKYLEYWGITEIQT